MAGDLIKGSSKSILTNVWPVLARVSIITKSKEVESVPVISVIVLLDVLRVQKTLMYPVLQSILKHVVMIRIGNSLRRILIPV